jgi:Ser-tRNA(Ala) deacylase AlaX
VSYQPVSSLAEEETFLDKNISPENSAVIMRQTIPYPHGGGQPSDTGSIAPVDQEPKCTVSPVRKTQNPPLQQAQSETTFSSAIRNSKVNDAKPDYHSRLHTGGHIENRADRH